MVWWIASWAKDEQYKWNNGLLRRGVLVLGGLVVVRIDLPAIVVLVLCLLFSLSFANRLATIYVSRLLQLHILPCLTYKLK